MVDQNAYILEFASQAEARIAAAFLEQAAQFKDNGKPSGKARAERVIKGDGLGHFSNLPLMRDVVKGQGNTPSQALREFFEAHIQQVEAGISSDELREVSQRISEQNGIENFVEKAAKKDSNSRSGRNDSTRRTAPSRAEANPHPVEPYNGPELDMLAEAMTAEELQVAAQFAGQAAKLTDAQGKGLGLKRALRVLNGEGYDGLKGLSIVKGPMPEELSPIMRQYFEQHADGVANGTISKETLVERQQLLQGMVGERVVDRLKGYDNGNGKLEAEEYAHIIRDNALGRENLQTAIQGFAKGMVEGPGNSTTYSLALNSALAKTYDASALKGAFPEGMESVETKQEAQAFYEEPSPLQTPLGHRASHSRGKREI